MELFDLGVWLLGTDASECEYYISDIDDAVEFMRDRGEPNSTILEYLCDDFGGDFEDIVNEYISNEDDIYSR